MAYFWELCNWQDSEEASLIIDIAGLSLQNSDYVLTGGIPSGHFFDLDIVFNNTEKANQLCDKLVEKISQLKKSSSYSFDKIAFIDKGEGGPVGLITCKNLLSSKLANAFQSDFLIIRPKKLLLRAAVKGHLNAGDKVLILSDVATTGRTIFHAAEKVKELGGIVNSSLVVFDRRQGATENLYVKGIQLFSISSILSLEERNEEIQNKHNRRIESLNKETILLDFGGNSSTSVYAG